MQTPEPYESVDTSLVCAITRFRLRHAHHLPPTYVAYRRVAREAARGQGLLKAAFLVENPTTWYSFSIWRDHRAIAEFGTEVPRHVEAAHKVFRRLAFDSDRGPELWSTKWRLDSVSGNLNWDDFDLRQALAYDVSA